MQLSLAHAVFAHAGSWVKVAALSGGVLAIAEHVPRQSGMSGTALKQIARNQGLGLLLAASSLLLLVAWADGVLKKQKRKRALWRKRKNRMSADLMF